MFQEKSVFFLFFLYLCRDFLLIGRKDHNTGEHTGRFAYFNTTRHKSFLWQLLVPYLQAAITQQRWMVKLKIEGLNPFDFIV
jgi:hypothetical protein